MGSVKIHVCSKRSVAGGKTVEVNEVKNRILDPAKP